LYIDAIHDLNLRYDNSNEAIQQRKQFLIKHKIGVCDIVESAERAKVDASDLGMNNIRLRNLLRYLKKFPKIDILLFTGGNSKNGPEYFFRKHLKEYNLKLELVANEIPRIHQFKFEERTIKTVSLTSASGSANRAIGSMPLYQQLKSSNPNFNTFDFRIMQYREYL
jgi:G:T/U-mismatch repair DNA glycosylase